MSNERAKTIEWDGNALSGWITIAGQPVKVSADRATINQHTPGWNDALAWEIQRFRGEIFEKLIPYFIANHR